MLTEVTKASFLAQLTLKSRVSSLKSCTHFLAKKASRRATFVEVVSFSVLD